MSDERVSIQRVRSVALDTCGPELIRNILRELGPVGGDYVIIRATPERAEAIEGNLVSQLFTMGAHVAGPPVGDEYPWRMPEGSVSRRVEEVLVDAGIAGMIGYETLAYFDRRAAERDES